MLRPPWHSRKPALSGDASAPAIGTSSETTAMPSIDRRMYAPPTTILNTGEDRTEAPCSKHGAPEADLRNIEPAIDQARLTTSDYHRSAGSVCRLPRDRRSWSRRK